MGIISAVDHFPMKPLLRTSTLALALFLGSGVSLPVFSQGNPAPLAAPVENASPAAPSADPSAPAAAAGSEEEKMSPEQRAFVEASNRLPWQTEGLGKIGDYAQIKIEPGYRFLPREHAAEWIKLNGNLPNPSVMGIYESFDMSWTAVYKYRDSGHVPDDEKNSLDAAKLLKIHQESNVAENEERQKEHMRPMTLIGWSMEPRYNEKSHNLEWGLRFRVDGGETINHETKLLSRTGIMEVVLVCDAQELEEVMPKYQASLNNFSFVEGHKYAEYKKGDKLATYGLTALAAGTGVAILAKTGFLAKFFLLFAKLGKAAVLVVVGIFMGIGRLLGLVKPKKTTDE